ncbi:MAG: hypothetical protein [Microvirus sp.]|nr:MAG: hypothetical protein [Microvirus sp.]
MNNRSTAHYENFSCFWEKPEAGLRGRAPYYVPCTRTNYLDILVLIDTNTKIGVKIKALAL